MDPFLRAAELFSAPIESSAKEWYQPNPDPTVTDENRWLRRDDGEIERDMDLTLEDGSPNPTYGMPLIIGRARRKQRPPTGYFFIWLALAGRGWGKTRTYAEWIDTRARRKRRGEQVLVAGRTPADVRDYALHGPGGLLTHHPDIEYISGSRLLRWPNGVEGLIRSGANPEEFRGFSGDTAWLDELLAWDYPQACWDNLMFGMREGRNPQIGISTTTRPLKVLKTIMAMPGVVIVRGSSNENRANLSEQWARNVLDPIVGTRLYRQEVEAEILDDVEGALWKLATIENLRRSADHVPPLVRIAVGVDPQGVKKLGSMTGVVVCGVDAAGELWVLEDASLNGTPSEWGTAVVAAYERWEADAIVAEKNFGGEMVESTISTIKKNLPIKMVTASRGKRPRAEPVSALYDQGYAHHVGTHAALETEMTGYTPFTEESPNRMDALVWSATELVLTEQVKKFRAGVPGRWGAPRG